MLYCYNGTWYSMCADDWDTTGYEARAICHSLGYEYNIWRSEFCRNNIAYDSKKFHHIGPVVVGYGRGTAPILQQNITCHSNHFSDCSTAELDVSQCKLVAGIDCQGYNVNVRHIYHETIILQVCVPALNVVNVSILLFVAVTRIVLHVVIAALMCLLQKSAIVSISNLICKIPIEKQNFLKLIHHKSVNMEQFVWWVESLTPLGDWSSVLVECGVECAITMVTGVPTIPELYADNLVSQTTVTSSYFFYDILLNNSSRFLYSCL